MFFGLEFDTSNFSVHSSGTQDTLKTVIYLFLSQALSLLVSATDHLFLNCTPPAGRLISKNFSWLAIDCSTSPHQEVKPVYLCAVRTYQCTNLAQYINLAADICSGPFKFEIPALLICYNSNLQYFGSRRSRDWLQHWQNLPACCQLSAALVLFTWRWW